MSAAPHATPDRADRGAALFAALIALLGATTVVLGLVVTAGAELAASRAQRAAAEELYRLESAVEEFIAENAPFAAEWEAPQGWVGGAGDELRIGVARLSEGEYEDGSIVRVFAVTAESTGPSRRSVSVAFRDSIPAVSDADPPEPVVTTARHSWFELVH